MNQLLLIDAFREVLTHYQPSEAAKQVLAGINLVLLSGPTSSGKNTIIGELLQTGDYHFVVSDTTRQPRENQGVMEQNGREYWFRSEQELLGDLLAGRFLEAAIVHDQQVSGTSIRELEAAAQEHKIALHELTADGAANIHAIAPNAKFFFIIPPSFDEWMVRMQARGKLPPEETHRRITSAVNEINQALSSDYYYVIVNDTYKHASRELHALSTASVLPDDGQARATARQLLADTTAYLSAQK